MDYDATPIEVVEARPARVERDQRDPRFERAHPRSRTGRFTVKQKREPARRERLRKLPPLRVALVDEAGVPLEAPYRLWLLQALERVPMPAGRIIVKRAPVPGSEAPAATTGLATPGPGDSLTIYLRPGYPQDLEREFFMHELGHAYDRFSMPEWGRQEWLRIMRMTDKPWRGGPGYAPPSELMAESYRAIATGLNFDQAQHTGPYGFWPSRRQYERLQDLFATLLVNPGTNAAVRYGMARGDMRESARRARVARIAARDARSQGHLELAEELEARAVQMFR